MPGVTRPGSVFHCLPSTKICSRLDIDHNTADDSIYFNGATRYFRHGRSDSWLGGTLQTPQTNNAGKFVTCAPKWYNRNDDAEWKMQGMCYEVPHDLNMNNVNKIPALTVGRDTFYINNKFFWNYAFGGLGTSVHYTQETNYLLMGAPGMTDWIGGFAALEGSSVKYLMDNRNTTNIPKPYVGYSSTSGKYFSDRQTYYAFGAPGESMTGSVIFFRAGIQTYWMQIPALILQGRDERDQELPLNSYFGAVLCTLDVNKDLVDDLIVSAPIYSPAVDKKFSSDLEIGAVFLYLGSINNMRFQSEPQMIKGHQPFGRFGSAVASLGDLNSDTFNDVAVGAPYEDGLKGAIYVYNGYGKGLWPQYSQRIAAANLFSGLAGFGISIASGMDIDNDNVNDMVVGSFLADRAVVLHGQPVITVEASLQVLESNGAEAKFIEINDKMSLKVCFRYSDRRCSNIRLNVTVTLDIEKLDQSRLRFNRSNLAEMSWTENVFNNDQTCSTAEQFYSKTTNDIVSDVVIKVQYDATSFNCPALQAVEAIISRFDGRSPGAPLLQLVKQMEFRNVCPDNICRTDLTLSAEAIYQKIGGYFAIGNEDFAITVQITKTGDAAYGTVFYLVYPSYLNYKSMETIRTDSNDVTCTLISGNETISNLTVSSTESALSCLAGNPILNETGVSFRLYFKVPSNLLNSSMTLKLSVSTFSDELQPKDNNQTLTVNFRHSLEAKFEGVSTYEELFLEDSVRTYKLRHIYELHNNGPSTVQMASVNISFPQIQTENMAVFLLNSTEVQCKGSCNVHCRVNQTNNSPAIYVFHNGRLDTRTVTAPSLTPVQNTNCSTSVCSSILCNVQGLQSPNSAVFYLNFVMDKSVDLFLKDTNGLIIRTTCFVAIDKTNLISNETEFFKTLSTTIRKRTPEKETVPWWIILVSILGGILLIVLITLILWKVGFFKRKKRDELQQRKSVVSDAGKVNKGFKSEEVNTQEGRQRKESFTDSEGGVIDKNGTTDTKY